MGGTEQTSRGDRIADLLLLYRQEKKGAAWWNEQIGADSGLSIESSSTKTGAEKVTAMISSVAASERRKDLATKGFALVDNLQNRELVSMIKHGIIRLYEQNIPAAFIFLFDEAWELARSSHKEMQASCHTKNKFNFDMLAWYIAPGRAGFSPHRDRQPENALSSFHNDTLCEYPNEPKFITHWIALSDARPKNSCLYFIPMFCDPGYLEGDKDDKDPLHAALPDKSSYQCITAVPRQQGQSVMFTHRLIHWGSKSESGHDEPRIAISFVCSDPEYEPPFLNFDCSAAESSLPPLHLRVLLVCAQLICYHQRFESSKATIKACYDYCKEFENELGETFRKNVFLEFVGAMEEQRKRSSAPSPSEQLNETSNSDEEDAMMEEMLNAEDHGYGEFEDDFDVIENTEDKLRQDDDVEEKKEIAGEGDDDSYDVDGREIFRKRALETSDSSLSRKVKQFLKGEDVPER